MEQQIVAPEIFVPLTIEEVKQLQQQYEQQLVYVAGGTLLQLRWQNGLSKPSKLVQIEQIDVLKQIQVSEAKLTIGALTTLASIRSNEDCQQLMSILPEAMKTIAAAAVRNRGTIGGNIMGGEGDTIPLLIALQATVNYWQEGQREQLPIERFIEIKQDAIFLETIDIPLLANAFAFYKKLGRRETFTAALVTVAGQFTYTTQIETITLAIGGGANKPLRLYETEAYLKGKSNGNIKWHYVYQTILNQYKPATDSFVTQTYKQKVAANMIVAAILQKLQHTVSEEAVSNEA